MSLPRHFSTSPPDSSRNSFRGSQFKTSSGASPHNIVGRQQHQRQQSHEQSPENADNYTERAKSVIPENERHADTNDSANDDYYRHPAASNPNPFRPFFTVIEDETSSEYYHPAVHYIFSDDDTDIITEAALRAFETNHRSDNSNNNSSNNRRISRARPVGTRHQGGDYKENEEKQDLQHDSEDQSLSPQKQSSLLPPAVPGVRENYIILDVEPISSSPETADTTTTTTAAAATAANTMNNNNNNPSAGDLGAAGSGTGTGTKSMSTPPVAATGVHNNTPQQQKHFQEQQEQFKVTCTNSLTPTWQVLDTHIGPAPTFETNTSNREQAETQDKGEEQQGLMLKIHGTTGLPLDNLVGGKEKGSRKLEEMMDQFAKRMSELRKVIETGQEQQMGGTGTGDCDGHSDDGGGGGGPPKQEQEQGQGQEQRNTTLNMNMNTAEKQFGDENADTDRDNATGHQSTTTAATPETGPDHQE